MQEGNARRARFRPSLGMRFALAVVGVLTLVFALLFQQLTARERDRLLASKVAAAMMVADLASSSVEAPLEFEDHDALSTELARVAASRAVRSVAVWSAHGTSPTRVLGEAHGDAARPTSDRVVTSEHEVIVERVVKSAKAAPLGALRISFSLHDEEAAYARTRRQLLLGVALLGALVSVMLVLVARRQIVLPVERLVRAATAIGGGNLTVRVSNVGDDELGTLAHAFNDMAESLADRERKLNAATESLREVFDHMRQGIVVFGPDGTVRAGVSRQAEQIFGSDLLPGERVRSLLYPDAPIYDVDAAAFDEWCTLAFETAPDQWETVERFAPTEAAVGPHGRPVRLEFRPVVRANEIVNVMVLVTDISVERSLQRAVETRELEYQRRLVAMRRVLSGGGQAFVSFVESASERLARVRALADMLTDHLPTTTIESLFREIHTVRGEARAFDFRELEHAAESFEEHLDEWRAAARGDGLPLDAATRETLAAAVVQLQEGLDRCCQLFVECSPIGAAVFDQITVRRSDLDALDALATQPNSPVALREISRRLRSRPFGEATTGVLDAAASWAACDDKEVRLAVENPELPVSPELMKALPGVITHLVKNAIAHGIEPAAERDAVGKTAVGTIRIAASETESGVRIVIEDDGRGVDEDALREATDGEDADVAMFRDGISTRASADALAGRGVGLAAVAADLAAVGYAVKATWAKGAFTRFEITPQPRAARRQEMELRT